ncbi:MAG TPA: helix-turn-helix transcriptional regulator [Candidatus Saccharimonadales bacterium]|nr:helix-turn-helix transcriptional regulator [Candidatus Saccharimonadales bacterium]
MATADDTTRKIGKKLKELRLERGMTQAAVAVRAKMHPNYYAKVERGDQKPSIEIYERIAKALKVTSADIFPF